MKLLTLSMIASSFIASSAFSQEVIFNEYQSSKILDEAQLRDGRKIDFKNDVERTYIFDHKIDSLELKNGEMVKRSEIFSIKRPDGHSLILKSTGVDGGG